MNSQGTVEELLAVCVAVNPVTVASYELCNDVPAAKKNFCSSFFYAIGKYTFNSFQNFFSDKNIITSGKLCLIIVHKQQCFSSSESCTGSFLSYCL
jgi:hypothetical protein